MSGPISSSTNGMICGFTARKSTSLLFTVSLLLVVRFTPIFCTSKKYKEQLVNDTLNRFKSKLMLLEKYALKLVYTHSHLFLYFTSHKKTKQQTNSTILTLRPDTVGRSVSGELAVIL